MKTTLERLYAHEYLTRQEAHTLMLGLADKSFSTEQTAAFLSALRMRDVLPTELLGFRDALMERAISVDLSAYEPLDIVGTGGDGKNTFNISTCACFIVAGAGYKVAKHGNYGATSVSGASTVLEQHGVKFTNDADQLRRSIDSCGVAYLHAPLFHPALAAVGSIRRSLKVKTIFNLLGPLVNPSHTKYQLLGVADLKQMRLYTATLQHIDIEFTVVTSFDGYDEISLTSDFKAMSNHSETIFSPSSLALPSVQGIDLNGGDTPQEAAAIFDDVLNGNASTPRTACVLANAAMGIHTICPNKPLEHCLEEARDSLYSGRAKEVFRHYLQLNS